MNVLVSLHVSSAAVEAEAEGVTRLFWYGIVRSRGKHVQSWIAISPFVNLFGFLCMDWETVVFPSYLHVSLCIATLEKRDIYPYLVNQSSCSRITTGMCRKICASKVEGALTVGV